MPEPNIKQIRKHILEGKPFIVNFLGVEEKIVLSKSRVENNENTHYFDIDCVQFIRVYKITNCKIYWFKWILNQRVKGNILFANCTIPETTEPCQKKF
jgi:hypothetical protein